jgi:mannitol/fructose-specific phosphotransferase system IIA component (Ntr-type)
MVYYPFKVNADFNIQPEWILMSGAGTLRDGIAEGLHAMSAAADTIDEQAILDLLMEQEREFSSVIGYNISLQHSYIDGVDDSLVSMVKLKEPVLGSLNENIENIFIVLSPRGMPNRHIDTLSKISQFVGNEETRRAISSALTEKELRAVFFRWNDCCYESSPCIMRSTASSSVSPLDMRVSSCLLSTLPMAASWVTWAWGLLTSTIGIAVAFPLPCMISLQSTCPLA